MIAERDGKKQIKFSEPPKRRTNTSLAKIPVNVKDRIDPLKILEGANDKNHRMTSHELPVVNIDNIDMSICCDSEENPKEEDCFNSLKGFAKKGDKVLFKKYLEM